MTLDTRSASLRTPRTPTPPRCAHQRRSRGTAYARVQNDNQRTGGRRGPIAPVVLGEVGEGVREDLPNEDHVFIEAQPVDFDPLAPAMEPVGPEGGVAMEREERAAEKTQRRSVRRMSDDDVRTSSW